MYKEITSALRRLSAPTTWTAVAITLVLTGCNDDKPMKPQTATPVVKRTTIKASGNESERDPVIQSHPLAPLLNAPPMTELARLTSAAPRAATEAPVRLDASTLIHESEPGVAELSDIELPFSVKRLTVTTGIENREPLEMDHVELGQSPIYAFVELSNPSDKPQEVVITFENPEGPSVGHVTLSVPANQPRWRTWGRTRMVQNAGEWIAVVKTVDGDEIARQSFSVESPIEKKPLSIKKKEHPSS